jgi:hypothetical protein
MPHEVERELLRVVASGPAIDFMGVATCVFLARDGRRFVKQARPSPTVVFPVARSISAMPIRYESDLLPEPFFGRQYFKLADLRMLSGQLVATYNEIDEPITPLTAAPPTAPSRWDRFLAHFRLGWALWGPDPR